MAGRAISGEVMGVPRAAGFTLLEILVSLAILAAILAGLAQGVHFGLTAWNTQVATIGRTASLETMDRTLRTLISVADPVGTPDQPSLVGAAHRISVDTMLPPGAPVRWTRRANVALLVSHHALVLRWSEQPHASLIGPAPPVHQEILLPGVESVDFSYQDATGTWTDSWTGGDLPLLVRIHLAFPGKSTERWPDMLIAPRRDALNGGTE